MFPTTTSMSRFGSITSAGASLSHPLRRVASNSTVNGGPVGGGKEGMVSLNIDPELKEEWPHLAGYYTAVVQAGLASAASLGITGSSSDTDSNTTGKKESTSAQHPLSVSSLSSQDDDDDESDESPAKSPLPGSAALSTSPSSGVTASSKTNSDVGTQGKVDHGKDFGKLVNLLQREEEDEIRRLIKGKMGLMGAVSGCHLLSSGISLYISTLANVYCSLSLGRQRCGTSLLGFNAQA